jgi:hypothetical protein
MLNVQELQNFTATLPTRSGAQLFPITPIIGATPSSVLESYVLVFAWALKIIAEWSS